MKGKFYSFWPLILVITCVKGAQVEVEPKEALVLPHSNVTFVCRMAVPLVYCRVQIPGIKNALNLNPKLSSPDVSYYGAGLSAGQCGLTIKNIKDANNGVVKCYMGVESDTDEAVGEAQLIVARAPKAPELDLSRGTDSLRLYKVNDKLQASCIVRDGRPAANITWFLDDEPLYGDGLGMPTVMSLAKENLQSAIQNLTRILQASDNGKHLRCVAYHPAYPNGKEETSRQLDVKFAPLPQRELDKFGYILDQAGVISVEVEANPKPQIQWTIGGETIREGNVDRTGRIEAEAARDLGSGRYEVNLRIAAIKKEDTEKEYILTAYNDMGSQDYRIKISTSPEPAGLEMGIGGIIGIVVSLFIILLVVFLLIFAKFTGRWCFSGQGDSRNLGETSDTESADVRTKETNKLAAINLTSFFKKNKPHHDIPDSAEAPSATQTDTTNETQAPPPQTSEEGNKQEGGLVYAELDLVYTNLKPVLKNDNEKTEYAEIVYKPAEEQNGDNSKK